ncbi:MAG: hypothetical protein R3A51_02455 [Nannocystaceae bacterium]|nr:hypothetical protein [Myxococcales bacterium]
MLIFVPQPGRALAARLALAGTLVAGCQANEAAPSEVTPRAPAAAEPENSGDSPFWSTESGHPPARSEPQLPADALEATLQRARELKAAKDEAGATRELRKCANKVPASPRCDGELGMLLMPIKNRHGECRYYLTEATKFEDPAADADFYRRLGQALRDKGELAAAVEALKQLVAREPDRADNHALYSSALQGFPTQLAAAADALAKARELDPTKPRWIYDEGLLRAQIAGQAAQAADLLKAYIDRTRGQDPDLEQTLLARIAELDATKADENSAKPHVLQ